MPHKPTDELSLAEAQFLMSQLIDGEIDPSDADRLNAYLERNPEAMAWMESATLASAGNDKRRSDIEAESMRNAVLNELEVPSNTDESRRDNNSAFLLFPILFRALGAAAALVVLASIAWFSLREPTDSTTSQFADTSSVVEFVDTDLPDASPIVYTDSESGWTIVWIEQFPQDAG